jgi:hypothetical protein
MPLEEQELSISEAVSNLALVALEHGLADRQGGADFSPFVLIESDGCCYVRHCRDANPVNEAAAFLRREPDTSGTYALAYDGFVTVEDTKFDAVLVIAGEFGSPGAFVFTQRYDASATPLTLVGEPAFIGEHASLLHKE